MVSHFFISFLIFHFIPHLYLYFVGNYTLALDIYSVRNRPLKQQCYNFI